MNDFTFISFPLGFFSTNSTPIVNLAVLDIIVDFQVMVHSSPFLVTSNSKLGGKYLVPKPQPQTYLLPKAGVIFPAVFLAIQGIPTAVR